MGSREKPQVGARSCGEHLDVATALLRPAVTEVALASQPRANSEPRALLHVPTLKAVIESDTG